MEQLEEEYGRLDMPGTVMPDPGDGTSFFDNIIPHPRAGTGIRSLHHYAWHKRPCGPIGLLCQNARLRGTAFDPGWSVCSKRRIPINILHTPTNHLTKALRHIHNTADFWVMKLSRGNFDQHPELDPHTTLKFAWAKLPIIPDEEDGTDLARKLHAQALAFHAAIGANQDLLEKHASETNSTKAAHPKAPLLLSILAGELWDIQTLYRAGLYHSDICLMCGNATGTFEHTTWYCPMHRKLRTADPNVQALRITPESFPNIIKNQGWAPSMVADPCQPFWGDNKPGVTAPILCRQHGYISPEDLERKWPAIARARHQNHFKDFKYADEWINNARGQTFNLPTNIDVPHVEGIAPTHPNAFSDGSVIRPSEQLTALGAFGIWHPQRTTPITLNQISVSERSTNDEFRETGIAIFSGLTGEAVSSGRTEAGGVLIAALTSNPVNVGVDNQSAVTTANAIINNQIDTHR